MRIFNGHFPDRVVLDENGNPILSWRAEVSPYLDYPPIDLSLAWDSEEQQNSKTANHSYNIFDVFDFKDQGEEWETNFVAISGKGTMWDDSKQMSYKDFVSPKNASNTIILMEIPPLKVHWMEPWDLSVDDFMHLRSKIFDPEKKVLCWLCRWLSRRI